MNAYNPLASMQRLESAGVERRQAEAIAAEIGTGVDQLVTKQMLDDALAAQTSKLLLSLGATTAAIVALACTVMGLLFSFK